MSTDSKMVTNKVLWYRSKGVKTIEELRKKRKKNLYLIVSLSFVAMLVFMIAWVGSGIEDFVAFQIYLPSAILGLLMRDFMSWFKIPWERFEERDEVGD